MNILAIDTSCDDTSVAFLKDGNIIANVISSQIEFHKEWQGIVPSLAKRLHEEKLPIVLRKTLKQAHATMEDVDYIAVTQGPGLAIALEAGIKTAKELAIEYTKPLIPINHMEGHIYSTFARNSKGKGNIGNIEFPYLVLLASGKHTELVLMKDHGVYEKLGVTLDDAVGEAFDKAGRMIGLGYPGGPIIAKMAEKGKEHRFPLPIPLEKTNDYNFSYSGLKTALARIVGQNPPQHKQDIYDLSASFQYAAIEEIMIKTKKALDTYKVNGLLLGGGVSANLYLRKKLRALVKKYTIPFYTPLDKKLCTDNGAMIGTCAYWKIQTDTIPHIDSETLERIPRMSL